MNFEIEKNICELVEKNEKLRRFLEDGNGKIIGKIGIGLIRIRKENSKEIMYSIYCLGCECKFDEIKVIRSR